MQKIAYNSAGGVQKTTWYVRDASGNVLSVYEKDGTVAIAQKELPVYGSGRVGIAMRSGSNYEYYYELKDHLGNVRAVVDVNKTVYSSSSYYPFGLAMQKSGSGYRYGYQGEFAEDETQETGWNSFEARMYDPVIGRWMAVDPARQFASPYIGMGNNPVNGIDPDGRDWFKDPDTGEPVWLGSTETFTDNAGVVWEHLSSDPDLIVATHNRDFNDVIGVEPINSATFDVYDGKISFFDPVGTITGNTVPAGQKTGEVRPSFGGRRFSTIAEGIYPARQQARASYPDELALIINEGQAIPTTYYSPRPTASEIFLHWGNPYRETLISRGGAGRQFSEGCLTTGCGEGMRERHVRFFRQHLIGFHGSLWLRGR